MQFTWRHLRSDEPDYELGIGVFFGTAWVLFLLAVSFVSPHWIPPCLLHETTGWPCPTCGSYRSFELLQEAQWLAALRTQPLVIALLCGGAVYALYSWTVVAFRLPRLRVRGWSRGWMWGLALTAAGLVAVNWLYLCWTGR